MNPRLVMANLMVRGRLRVRWLRAIDRAVVDSISPLLREGASGIILEHPLVSKDASGFIREMSQRHALLVEELISQMGVEEGVRSGREAMFRAGVALGADIRGRLGLSGNPKDLISAARLLYRILGIEFHVDEKEGRMEVERCALSLNYTPITCRVISAMDEGVVSGLNPGVSMKFINRNEKGRPMCIAELAWGESE